MIKGDLDLDRAEHDADYVREVRTFLEPIAHVHRARITCHGGNAPRQADPFRQTRPKASPPRQEHSDAA